MTDHSRRRLLKSGALAAALGLAGCNDQPTDPPGSADGSPADEPSGGSGTADVRGRFTTVEERALTDRRVLLAGIARWDSQDSDVRPAEAVELLAETTTDAEGRFGFDLDDLEALRETYASIPKLEKRLLVVALADGENGRWLAVRRYAAPDLFGGSKYVPLRARAQLLYEGTAGPADAPLTDVTIWRLLSGEGADTSANLPMATGEVAVPRQTIHVELAGHPTPGEQGGVWDSTLVGDGVLSLEVPERGVGVGYPADAELLRPLWTRPETSDLDAAIAEETRLWALEAGLGTPTHQLLGEQVFSTYSEADERRILEREEGLTVAKAAASFLPYVGPALTLLSVRQAVFGDDLPVPEQGDPTFVGGGSEPRPNEADLVKTAWKTPPVNLGPFAVTHRVPLEFFGDGAKQFAARGVWHPVNQDTKARLDQSFTVDPNTLGPE